MAFIETIQFRNLEVKNREPSFDSQFEGRIVTGNYLSLMVNATTALIISGGLLSLTDHPGLLSEARHLYPEASDKDIVDAGSMAWDGQRSLTLSSSSATYPDKTDKSFTAGLFGRLVPYLEYKQGF